MATTRLNEDLGLRVHVDAIFLVILCYGRLELGVAAERIMGVTPLHGFIYGLVDELWLIEVGVPRP